MPAVYNEVGTPATPHFAEILCRGVVAQSVGARSVVQVWHLRQRAPFVAGNLVGLLGNFAALMDPLLSAALSTTYTAIDWRGRFMDDPTSADSPVPNNITGAITGDRLPTFNAVTMQLRSDARGRSFRGSKHFAPIAESDTTLDKLNAGAQGRWDAVAAGLIAGLPIIGSVSDEWDLIVLSTTLSDLTANPSVFTYAYVQDATANAIVGTMKRRKEKSNT